MSENSTEIAQTSDGAQTLNLSSGVSALTDEHSSLAHATDAGVSLPTHLIPSWESIEDAIPARIQRDLNSIVSMLAEAAPGQKESTELLAGQKLEALSTRFEAIKSEIADKTGLNSEDVSLESVIESLAMETLLERPEALSRVINSIELINDTSDIATNFKPEVSSGRVRFFRGWRGNQALPSLEDSTHATGLENHHDYSLNDLRPLAQNLPGWEQLDIGDDASGGYAMVRRVRVSRSINGKRKSDLDDPMGVGLGSSELESDRGGDGG